MWWITVWALAGVFMSSTCLSPPITDTSSLVVSSTEHPKEKASEESKVRKLLFFIIQQIIPIFLGTRADFTKNLRNESRLQRIQPLCKNFNYQ